MSKKKVVFNAYELLNSPEMSAYLDQHEAEQAEKKKRQQPEMAASQSQTKRDPEPAERAWSEAAHDTGLAAVQGVAGMAGSAAWLGNQIGIGDGATAADMQAFSDDIEKNQKSEKLRQANSKVAAANGVRETLAAIIDNPIAIGDMIAQSAPMAVPGMGVAGIAGKGALAAGKGLVAQRMAATVAGIGTESLTTAGMSGNEVYQHVSTAAPDVLRKNSSRFRELEQEMGAEGARTQLANESARTAALLSGSGTAVGGAVAGKVAGKLGLESGYATATVGKELLTPTGLAKNLARESMEEAAQSPLEDIGEGYGRKRADNTIDPYANAGKSALLGAVAAVGQTGATSAMQGARNGVSLREAAPVSEADATAQPVQPQPSTAEYDPIAPNQQALLRRMGVEPDPVAEAATASVESVLGKGDPTAGLVASVMRGDALQPIHDLAAVRANTILPVGSNEGGLYEPQWLPDAAHGESANGLPMPKHGFDSQEKLLGNARLDARDADLMRAKDEAFARYEQEQQQAAARKPKELEQVYQDSIVPAEIERADAGNQLNQALASASGEGVAVPNAMQLALQKAQKQGTTASLEENAQKLQTSIPSRSGESVVAQPQSTPQRATAQNSTAQTQADAAPNIADQAPSIPAPAPNISSEPALSMHQNERGQWLIKGDMAQHAQTIREALPGTKLVISQQKGQALVQMPADKNTAKQGKDIRKALDHLVMSGEQLAQRDKQRADASERLKARNQQTLQIDHSQDDILQAVAKLGGIDTEQALSEWWRGQAETVGHYNAEVPGNLRRQGAFAFKRGGQPIDTVIRRLEGEGYLPEGATPNDLLDALENRSLHPAGMEERARREFEARQQEDAPGEFQQAYDDGRFADEFTKRELEEETDYFELNRQNREAAEDAAATAEAAELDRLIDNAPVIASKSGPVTEEELDAIFGPQSRNTTAESPQADREPAAGRSMEGAESGTATAEAAPEENGFSLAVYTESDLRREERAAEQQQREVERQRAAADKARQEEETRKEIRRRSEAAADTFVLGGNAEDNLTGQGGLFDAPAETEYQRLKRETDALRAKASDLIHANDHRSEDAGRALDDFNDKVIGPAEFAARLNRIEVTPAPDGKNSRFEQKIKIAANGVESLRASDVGRVLEQQQSPESLQALADYITQHRPDLSGTVQRDTAALKEENGWSEGPKRGKVGMMLAPGEVVLTASGRETTPFPKFQTRTGKTTARHLAEVDKWLLQNAATEALSRGDTFNAPVFQRAADNTKSISKSDKDSAEEYLFGEQPAVKPSILKPLVGANNAESQSSSAQNTAYSPEKVPDLAPNAASSAEMEALKAEMGDAIGELASILGARKNLTPEEESRIIPVMSKIFRIAAKMGFVKFRDAAQHVMSQIRQLAGNEIADKLSIDNLQAGYINIASEIGGDKREALAYDSIEQLEKDKDHVTDQRSGSDLERNSADATPENGVGAQGVRAGRAGNGRTGRSGVESTQGEVGQRDSIGPDEREAADSGERSDSEVYAGSPIVTPGSAGSRVDIGSTDSGIPGLPVEPQATSQIARVAKSDHRKQLAKDEQREADKHAANASVADALPILTEGQQQDVVKAEARFALPDGYGMLFTNGTGTGKTFTGLGVIKRFVNNGKTNILVVAPNDKIIEDWQRSGKMLGLDLTRLENTNSAGTGPVITTYANMGANNALAGRDWDLVVHDEAHYLAMDKDGTNTNALKVLRAISLHHDGAYHRHAMLNADEIALANRLAKEAEMQRTSDNEQEWYLANETQAKADKLANELSKKLDAIKADVASRQGAARTRVVFLSATPFAYEKTIDWANGYLFDYNEGRGNEENSYRGYNEGSNRDQFFMQHFGYWMRYGKLTAPKAKVDAGLMQRQFNAYLKKKGSLSGRMLDVKADYDRRFILVDSAIGKRIDDAFEWLREKSAGTDASAIEYWNMINHLYEKFDYLARRYLLESIKAREVVPHIREHMALGRKVVVFHDYKKGGGFNPFIFSGEMFDHNAVDAFNQEFRDIINSSLFRQSSPIDMFKQEFPDVLLFNGDVPANQRRANVAKFQDDASGPQIILVQSAAGKEGISLHDTTGKHQRVLFNLGQPTQPTTAIQQEGRIYRTGQVTDAIFRYLNTGTTWEKIAFAHTIARRASAAENLGMGEMSRALKDAFIAGFEESDNYRAGMEGEGKGGKERDRAANDALTEYDRARSFYFGTQKKNAQTKAKEGKDYFATPEPVGLKMAEFADVRPGESVLEPSAGHGAIARWLPEDANRTAIEPSTALRARLAMVFDGKIIDSDFEGHNIVNKYDAIVMNPPFGVGGKTAVDHLSKAAGHLREGGRVVALLPSGPAADKRLDNFLYGETEREVKPLLEHPTLGPVYRGDTVSTNAAWAKQGVLSRKDRGGGYWLEVKTPSGKSEYQVNPAAWTAVEATGKRKETYRPAGDLSLVADIKLPSVTFERAGTGVMTHIIVLEKGKAGAAADVQQVNRDLAGIDNINDLFKRMENMTLPKRVNAAEPRIQESSSESGAVESSGPEAGASGLDIVEHTTAKGKVLRGVIRTDLTQAQAKEIDPYTFKKDGGYFIRDRYLGQGGTLNSTASHTTTQQRMTQQQLQDLLHKAVPPHLRGMIKVAQSRNAETGGSNTHQSTADEVIDDVEATYDPTTNEITFYADAMDSPERALFVLSHELTHYGLDAKYGFGLSNILLETRNNPMIAKLAAAIAVDRSMTVNSVRQDIADALGVPVARIARSAAIHRLQVETANEALAELNAAIERNDFAYLQDRYGVAVPKMMRNDLRGRLARLAASVKAWLAKLTGKQSSEYSDKQVWDLLVGVRDTVLSGSKMTDNLHNSDKTDGESAETLRSTADNTGMQKGENPSDLADKLEKKYPGIKLDIMGGNGKPWVLSRIVIPEGERNSGVGTNVMQDVLRSADAMSATVALTPSGDFGGNKKRLVDFYKRFGFVENKGRNKDYSIMESMYRQAMPTGTPLRSTAQKQPASAGFSLPEETKTQTAQREVQDNMNRWKQVLENVREQGGQVDEQNDVYGAEERFHGRAATRIEDFARDEVEPLMQRLADSGNSLQEVEQYLLAQHAEEANARIREIDDSRDTAFGMEDGEAQSILAKFAAMPNAAEFKRLANDFRRISEGTLSLYVKAGIVSPEAAHAMRMAYQFYVPVKGGDEDQAARQGTGKGLSVNGKQKRRMGHDMRDEHVLENMLRDRQRAIILAEKNNVGTYLLDLINRNPDPKMWTVNVLPKQKVLRNQVAFAVERNGQIVDSFANVDAAERFIDREVLRGAGQAGEFNIMKSSDPYVTMMAKPTLQDHEVQVYVQGRAVRIQLHDPILAGQYRRMGTEQMGRIIEAGKSLNRWLSKVYTGYNPEFFVKNVVRDLFAGTINLTADQGAKVTAKALLHWPKAGAAMFHFALHGKAPTGEYGKALQRYRAAGGSTGAAYMGDLERQADTLNTLYENYSGAWAAVKDGKPGKAAKIATRKLLGGLAHWFEVWNQAGENAFRLATFMAMQESGKTVAESASMAKNVTVNFNRKGELTPQLGGLYLFFNPGVQGTARLWQSLAGKDTKHKKQAWALVGSMAGAALALAMMNRGDDEDEWEAIPDSVKDRNLIIPLGNKRKLTIPLPYGYSFFVSLANRLDALMHGESAEKASIRMASSFFENFSPVGNPIGDDPKLENMLMLLPTAIKIPALPAANITDFGGPMRPDYKETQPDNEKMWRGTRGSLYDKAAQGIASLHGSPYENNWNDISPETIKYLFKTLAGGTGGFMADSASLLNVLASGSAPDVSEVPFLRSAVRESTVKDARARFYDLGKDAKGHVEAWKRAVEAGDDKAAGKYEQDGELMALGEMLSGYKEQASTLRDLMAEEMKRDDLSLSEKRLKQKMYEKQEADVYSEFIKQFKH